MLPELLMLVYDKLDNISKQILWQACFQKLEFVTLGTKHLSFEGQNRSFSLLREEGGKSEHIFPVEVVTEVRSVVKFVILELYFQICWLYSNPAH